MKIHVDVKVVSNHYNVQQLQILFLQTILHVNYKADS